MRTLVGQKLKEVREKHNLTQLEVANKTGLQMVVISNVESGRRKMSADIAVRLELMEVFEMTAHLWMDLQIQEDIVWARKDLEQATA